MASSSSSSLLSVLPLFLLSLLSLSSVSARILLPSDTSEPSEPSLSLTSPHPSDLPSSQASSRNSSRTSSSTSSSFPLIGILSQPGDGDGGETINGTHNGVKLGRRRNQVGNYSYIAASYVKWVEMGGARAVPILYNEPEEVLIKKFKAVNGLLFPGGGTNLEEGPFLTTARKLWKMALAENDEGRNFPVQGTCMGMELLTVLVSEDPNILELNAFDSQNYPSPLNFVGDWAKNRSMFAWMSEELLKKVEEERITMENHEDGTSVERFFSNKKLRNFFDVLTTSPDKKGKVYVSTIAAKQYPVFATQWHPEKNAFEWGLDGIPHSAEAVAVTQASSNHFVSEARKCGSHSPSSNEELDDFLIYNYTPIFSGKDGQGFFDQSYVFNVS